MENFKKTALNIALAGAVFVGFSLPAHATGVLATATLELTKLLFTKDDGSNFSNLNFAPGPTGTNEVNNASAELNGVSETSGLIQTSPFLPGADIDLPFFTPTTPVANDLCVGLGCPGIALDNDFNTTVVSSAAGDPAFNRAYSDSLIKGSVIDFDPDRGGPIPLIPTSGANIGVEATVSLIGDGSAAAGVTNSVSSTVQFTYTGPATHFNISFDATGYMEAFIDDLPKLPQLASAITNYSQLFTLKELNTGLTILNWSPGTAATKGTSVDAFDMNANLSADQITASFVPAQLPAGQLLGVAQFGSFSAKSNTFLTTGNTYQLTATTNASVSASLKVPEPASIALFGLGLLGLSQIRRKKQA